MELDTSDLGFWFYKN